MSISKKQQEIVAEFSLFDDWMDKYQHLIEMGKTLPLIDASEKTEDKLIKGCQSKVWLHAQLNDDRVVFTADSDAVITKGIIAILIRVFSMQPPEAVVQAKTDFIDEIGLKEHLSPTRANGLVAMIKQMKLYALAFETQMNEQ
ncbi:SufE family protein [Altibacter sp. HG106]|uniref:SufE family protein n=1 Tax=Altibacter sp. HG106 TaxID=3023937 RepID=UPI0023506222|nr:SufE family protein [Altibacter sp. HG106]MDC7995143.1 SufE family protein [Altibacter sp. HG106]